MSLLSPEQINELGQFWPTSEGVNAIPLDAAAFDRNLFLALHQPMVFSLRNEGAPEAIQHTEEQLLERFLREQGSGVTISVLEGQSGVGKSHAIRWLEAHIADNTKYVVIWVPRNRSAKWVLKELLQRSEFRGDEYNEIRTRLTSTVEPMGVVEAGWSLRVKLVLALQQEPPPGFSPEEREFFVDFAEDLAEFVSDHHIWRLPPPNAAGSLDASANPLLRLARHLVGENIETRGVEDRLFIEKDLDLESASIRRAGEAAREFWEQYLRPNIRLSDGNTTVRNATVGLLNRLLDEARAGVLGLDVNPIAGLFIDLRRMLHQEGKELVLLIEDFTVMAGLQRSLLDIMVATATTAAGNRICPIRTALALTPGYMHGAALPTNVRTRADMYSVEDRIDEEEALRRYEALAGAFLNVGRLTRNNLEKAGPGASFDRVAGTVDDDVKSVLRTFGRSVGSDQWLFPLNRDAISTLAYERVREGNQLVYNPRLFMRNVLLAVLEQRNEFLAGDFPNSASGLPERVSAVVQQELAARVSPTVLGKYRRVLATWGGGVPDWEQACRIPSGIFEAFALEPLEAPLSATAVGSPEKPVPLPTTPPGLSEPEDLPAHFYPLEAWRAGEVDLNQDVARELRKAAADIVVARLPRGWPGLPRYSASSLFGFVYVPQAKGNRQLTPETAFVIFSTDEDLQDLETAALHHLQADALLRWGNLADKTPRPELFETVSRASAFARRVQSSAADWLTERPTNLKVRTSPETVQSWVNAQLTLAEAQGRRWPRDVDERLQMLFPDDPSVPISAPPEWQQFLESLRSVSGTDSKAAARSGMLKMFGAFQGGGSTPAAIDAARLWDFLCEAISLGSQTDVMSSGLGAAGTELVRNQRALLRMVSEKLRPACRELADWTGGRGPNTVFKALQELAHEARNSNVGTLEARSLLGTLGEVDAGKARMALSLVQKIAEGIESSKLLATLGAFDWMCYGQLQEIRRLSDSLMEAIESSQKFQAAMGATMDHGHIDTAFRAMLDALDGLLEQAGA